VDIGTGLEQWVVTVNGEQVGVKSISIDRSVGSYETTGRIDVVFMDGSVTKHPAAFGRAMCEICDNVSESLIGGGGVALCSVCLEEVKAVKAVRMIDAIRDIIGAAEVFDGH